MGLDLQEELVKRHLVELLSVYTPTGEEHRLHPVLRDIVVELGGVYHIDEVGNFIASSSNESIIAFRRGSVDVALLSHLDTVPGFIEPRVDDNIVYGRGAVDAKAPLLAMVYAAVLFKRKGCTVVGGGLVAEEGDSRGAMHLIERGFRAKHIIVGEPSGVDTVVVGYRGSAPTILRCRGEGGHAASGDYNASAFEKLLEYYSRLRGLKEPSIIATIVSAGEYPNKLPEYAEMRLDVRLPRGWDRERLEKLLSEAAPEGCSFEILSYTPPVYVKPSDPAPRALQRGVLRVGLKPRIAFKRGTSDMNLLYKVCESIASYGPGDPRLAHSRNEHIDARDVIIATRVLLYALEELCQPQH